jgi:hypothetical protein
MILHLQNVADAEVSRRDRVRAALTGILLLLICVLIASTYFGHSTSPYGACYVKSGRQVPCELLPRAP